MSQAFPLTRLLYQTVTGNESGVCGRRSRNLVAQLTIPQQNCGAQTHAASAPETTGDLGMFWHVERSQQRPSGNDQRKFLQIKFGRLAQIGQCFLDGFALGGRPGLRIEGDISPFRGRGQNSGEFHKFSPNPRLVEEFSNDDMIYL